MTEVSTAKTNKAKSSAAAPGEEGVITCTYCGDTVPSLVIVDTGLRIGLQDNAQLTSIPDAVCAGCHSILSRMVSKGAALRAHAQAKEQNKLLLWRNRVALVKKAKEFLAKKNFGEAAVHYEKYLRVLELVFDKKAGELTPELFSSEARKQELTVVASVYWDLMRIYDQSSRYRDRQNKAALKLAEFVRFTPIYGHIMRKAETQSRTAKNAEAYRQFLKLSNKNRPRCFIASAAFEGAHDPVIDDLRYFRDRVLRRSPLGRRFTRLYYRYSPPVARLIDRSPAWVRASLRHMLRKAALRLPQSAQKRGGSPSQATPAQKR